MHLFPCFLSLSFSSDGINPIESLYSVVPSFIDENSLSYSFSSDDIIRLNDFSLLYASLHFSSSSSSRMLIAKRRMRKMMNAILQKEEILTQQLLFLLVYSFFTLLLL
jgi:hypothetical protein